MNFVKMFQMEKPEKGWVSIAWTGQAGFLIKNSQGKILAIDIYLSDLSEKQDGNKRLTPALFEADELKLDVLLATHHHSDHLDLESIPTLLNNQTRLYCCKESYRLCQKLGVPMECVTAMGVGDWIEDSGFRVEAVFADHGDAAPEAVGFLIEAEGIRVYFTGDTSYQNVRMGYAARHKIDVLILPINGEYGNLNERDAAMLAKQMGAGLTIPCHFWTFARHQGSPYQFQQEMRAAAPECNVCLMAQGEIIRVQPS